VLNERVRIGYVYPDAYGFSETQSALVYLAPGVGMLAGLFISGRISDRIVKSFKARGQQHQPEDRIPLPVTLSGMSAFCVGLLLHGWVAEKKIHWSVSLVGLVFFGFGLMVQVLAVNTYLVESYLRYAASALAANNVLRALASGLLPLSGLKLYRSLGYVSNRSIFAPCLAHTNGEIPGLG
jgi:MFS family permease